MLKNIAHIAVAVKNLDEAVSQITKIFSVKASTKQEVPSQKVRIQFVELGGVKFEFLEPTSNDSPISKFLEKRGNGIHHIAFKTEDLESRLKSLKLEGVRLIDEKPKKGAEECSIAFLHPQATAGILMELIEGKGEH